MAQVNWKWGNINTYNMFQEQSHTIFKLWLGGRGECDEKERETIPVTQVQTRRTQGEEVEREGERQIRMAETEKEQVVGF